ncbi:galanin receptor 2b-like [Asterias amurensis]|uniref:galanin receptor 2b-like n=1 Tax=Asterias amurensis TaxID=7602 RepID=UPI003AB14DC1
MAVEKNVPLNIFRIAVGVLGVCGNCLVCVVIAKVKFMHTITNAFIFNQAVIDFFGSLLILLSSLIAIPDPIPSGVGGVLLCNLWISNYFVWGLFITSTFNLVALTLERYLAIVFPFKYQNLATAKTVTATITCVWVAGFLFHSYGLFIYYLEDGQCKQKLVANPQVLGVAVFAVTYFLPVSVMLIVYIHISVVLKKGAGRIGPAPASVSGGRLLDDQRESLMRARRNTFKTLLIVFITFTVCWTPNEAIFFLFNLGLNIDFTSTIYIISVAMVAVNGCLNPLIYAIKYKQFRKAVRALFGRRDVNNTLITTNGTE